MYKQTDKERQDKTQKIYIIYKFTKKCTHANKQLDNMTT